MRTATVRRGLALTEAEPKILCLGGWSPGPLIYLVPTLTRRGIGVLEPPLEMPPVSPLWFWHWRTLVLFVLFASLVWFANVLCSRAKEHSWHLYIGTVTIFCAVTIAFLRLMVADIVQKSIRRNVDTCRRLLLENNVVLVVGFSWGGAIASELVAQGLIGLDSTQPSALLIAPTTAVVSNLCLFPPYNTDAALRIPIPQDDEQTLEPSIHVVHAEDDRFFCPCPERWMQTTRARMTVLVDNHVFLRRNSQFFLVDTMNAMIQAKTLFLAERVPRVT